MHLFGKAAAVSGAVAASVGLLVGCGRGLPATGDHMSSISPHGDRDLELVADIPGPMPTGVTISRHGRMFVNFPRWGDDVHESVAEVVDGKVVAYPADSVWNNFDPSDPEHRFLSVQSVVIDSIDHLWVLDTGRALSEAAPPGGPKLVEVDLGTDQVIRTIPFESSIAGPMSSVNDIRIDRKQGEQGTIYVTDASPTGSSALIVVDIASGQQLRRLDGDRSTAPTPGFFPTIEGKRFENTTTTPPTPTSYGADGIALSPDGSLLYYCPFASLNLYSVPTAALRDPGLSEQVLSGLVTDLGVKGMSDGLESDAQGNVYAGDLERQAIVRRNPDGRIETIAASDQLKFTDTFTLGYDGYLYFTVNQINRQPGFNNGVDRRTQPYQVMRLRIDALPARR